MARTPAAQHVTQHTIIRAAIYIRVSTEEQAKDGYGLVVQEERCRAMAMVKGWQVEAQHIYRDEGISGMKDTTGRPGLAAMLDAAQAGQVDAIIVLALERLGRKTNIILDLVERITAAGVEVVSCKESLDTTTPAGRFVLGIFAGLAQLERDTIVERTTSGRNARGRRDGEKGGRVPFGYRRNMTTEAVEVEPSTAPIVHRIFGLRSSGATMRAIASELAASAAQTPQGGGSWRPSSVKAILDNEAAYRGGTRNDSPTVWPRIL